MTDRGESSSSARRRALAAMAAACLLAHTSGPALAQSYPSAPIRIIVPFPAGASLDTVVRLVAQRMTEGLGQNVFVENKTGAGGIIGIGAGAKAPADGYHFTAVANSFAGNTLLRKDLPYDAFKDFVPVTLLGTVPHVLVSREGLPVKSLPELIAYAKQNPGKISYSSGGIGTSSHLGGEMLSRAAGIALTHVPYRGQGPALLDVIAGQVDLTLGNMPEVIPHAKAGTLRPLAVVATERLPLEPGWQTLKEQGFPEVVSDSWFGLVAPAGTPPEVVTRFQREAARVLAIPEVRNQLEGQGFLIAASTPQAFKSFLESTTTAYRKVIDEAGIKLD
jgi:tripartite-type tricarboxylate transporter receptor subunit TctC